jgi:hypothetical protein
MPRHDDEEPIYWNDLPAEGCPELPPRPEVTFGVAVLLVGSDHDGFYFLTSYEDWMGLEEGLSVAEAIDAIPPERVARFLEMGDLVNFCVEHRVAIRHSSEGSFD